MGEGARRPLYKAGIVDSEGTVKTVHPYMREVVDIMFITDDNRVVLTLHRLVGSSSIDWANLFAEPASYELQIKIISEDLANPPLAILLFEWTGDRNTMRIEDVTGKASQS